MKNRQMRLKDVESSKCRQLTDCLIAFQLHPGGADSSRASVQAKHSARKGSARLCRKAKRGKKKKKERKEKKVWLTPHRSQLHQDRHPVW